jgi:hypothetical protein
MSHHAQPWFSFIERKFASHKINHFKVNDSVTFSVFTVLCQCPHCLVPEHFHHPKRNPSPSVQ